MNVGWERFVNQYDVARFVSSDEAGRTTYSLCLRVCRHSTDVTGLC
jgi:hypothetical protein